MSKHSIPESEKAHDLDSVSCRRINPETGTTRFCTADCKCLEDYQGCMWQQAETVMGAQFRFVVSRLQKDLEYLQRLGTCSDPTDVLAQTEQFFTDMAEDYTVHSTGQYEALQDQFGTSVAAAQRLGQITANNYRDIKHGQ